MLSKQLRKVSVLSLNSNLTKAMLESLSQNTATEPVQLKTLLSQILCGYKFSEKNPKITAIPWLKHTEIERNQLLSDLTAYYRSKQDLETRQEIQICNADEGFSLKCRKIGISSENAKIISMFLNVLSIDLPENFTQKDLVQALQKIKHFSIHHKENYSQTLRHELKDLEKKLNSLSSQYLEAKSQAETFSNYFAVFGTTVLSLQTAGVCYFGLLLEAFEAVQMGLATSGVLTGLNLGLGKLGGKSSLTEKIYKLRLERLLKKRSLNLDSILLLQREIENIRNELLKLN